MFKFGVAALAMLACASAVPTLSESQKMFDDFIAKYHKTYLTQEEYNSRLSVFRSNLEVAEQLTATGTSTHGVTKFMDLTPQEFTAMYTGFDAKALRASLGDLPVAKPLGSGAPPASVDWRTKGVVTPVKDQGQCGSCWAFSATEEIETSWILAGNSMAELSPQQIVDCDTAGQDQGCNGGYSTGAYQYVMKYGIETEAAYPYTSGLASNGEGSGSCHYNAADVAANVTGYKYGCTEGQETTMQANLATLGPMSICLATGGWQTYTSGILTAATCGTQVDHCVQAVGYNTGSSQGSYWIVRNSWNTDWGVQGYIYLQFGANACDLTSTVTYVQTAKP